MGNSEAANRIDCDVATVYTASIAPLYDDGLFSELYAQVSEIRQRKIDSMKFKKDKCLSLGVELLLMRACEDYGIDYYSETSQDISTKTTDCDAQARGDSADLYLSDKPHFRSCSMHYNLSHSEERVMCIISEYPVGCDVELIRPIDMSIAKQYFSAQEYEAIMSCDEPRAREEMFYRFWTLKESFMKCTGLGFKLALDEFEIEIGDERSVSASREDDEKRVCCMTKGARVLQNVDEADYLAREIELEGGYRYAFCVKCTR